MIPAPASDLRLIAVDMDGTLLDGEGRVPDGLWELLERLRERGIAFVPASGRQYATLREGFAPAGDLAFIAENGTYVVRGGQEISSDVIDPEVVERAVTTLRALSETRDIGVVVCGKESAYAERTDAAFLAEADKYYKSLRLIDDVLDHGDEILKIAVYDFAEGAPTAEALAGFATSHQVVLAGLHWVDIMNADVNKGTALRHLQDAMGITPAQTAAFGDYLNDLELLDAADYSFAMANAHPDVLTRARYLAPANTENGVLRTIEHLLGDDVADGSAL